MGLTRFPNGLSSFGMPVLGGSYIPPTKGNYYWVDSNATMNGTGDFDNPFTSVVSAIAASAANNDDVIIMKQGHAESITAAGTWTPKAGTTIVGLGFGSRKPLITWSTVVGATVTVSAANVTFINFDCTSGIAELDVCFTVSGEYCTFLGVTYRETNTSYMVEDFIATTTAGNYLTVKNCRFIQVTAPTANAFCIKIVGADDVLITDNVFWWNSTSNAASGGVGVSGTAALRLTVSNNVFTIPAAAALAVLLINNTTGTVTGNRGTATAAATVTLADSAGGAENYFGAVTKGGTLIPAA